MSAAQVLSPGKNPTDLEAIFKKLDVDSSGSVNLEDFKSHLPPHKPGEGKPGGPGKPGKPKGEGVPPAQ